MKKGTCNFTESEIEFLKNNFGTMTYKEMASTINRSYESICYLVRKLGLKKQVHKDWSNNDLEYLTTNFENKTVAELARDLDRTEASVNTQLQRMGLSRTIPWSDQDVEFLKDNYLVMTHEEIAQELNRTTQAVTAKCFDLDLYKKEKPWTSEEIEYVRQNYMEMPTRDIALILGRSYGGVKLKAERLGFKKYPYYCDYRYFSNIDNEEKAYWLGFMTADGWISQNEKTHAGVTGVELQYGDLAHLKKLNKSLRGNYKITDRWRECSLSNSKKKNHSCVLRIFSMSMYKDLKNIGFTNQKSFDGKIPDLREDLLRHFIRGYFDGNGCFCLTNKSFSIGFCTASLRMNNDLVEVLEKIGIHLSDYQYVSEYETTIFAPAINKHNEKLHFLDYIYSDCSIYLDRKYKKYLKAKEKYSH